MSCTPLKVSSVSTASSFCTPRLVPKSFFLSLLPECAQRADGEDSCSALQYLTTMLIPLLNVYTFLNVWVNLVSKNRHMWAKIGRPFVVRTLWKYVEDSSIIHRWRVIQRRRSPGYLWCHFETCFVHFLTREATAVPCCDAALNREG